MTIVFQNCYTKHPNKVLLEENLRIFDFARDFEKFESTDFKYGDSFSNSNLNIPK